VLTVILAGARGETLLGAETALGFVFDPRYPTFRLPP